MRNERLDVLGVLLGPDTKLQGQVGWHAAVRLRGGLVACTNGVVRVTL